jgi:nicotinic acid mononucleotide adenylyltransferase
MTTLEPYQDDNQNPQIVFTIGRMNPPTPGHLLLIKQMIVKAAFLHLFTFQTPILRHKK